MAESTVWRVMHTDGSRTVVGHYPLALAYANSDRRLNLGSQDALLSGCLASFQTCLILMQANAPSSADAEGGRLE